MRMDQPTRPTGKRNRSSGKHSRTGCGTCKIRRVKCDEGKPICNRCAKFGITCDGYSRQSRTPSPRSRSQGLSVITRTRAPSLSSVLDTSLLSKLETDGHVQYFDMFRDQTSFQLTPLFDSDSFRILVLQCCGVPAVRHAVISIGALAKACMTFHKQKSDQSGSYTLDHKMHHGAAITEYSKALSLMRVESGEGRQDLRTTLITSLLIACFESCHGNYALADAQVESGIGLINNWRNSYPDVASEICSPAPGIVGDLLVQIFDGLELQSSLFGTRNTTDQHRAMMHRGETTLQAMPERFRSLDAARVYLQLMIRRLLHWMHSIELPNDTGNEGVTIPKVQSRQEYAQEQFLNDLLSDSSINPSTFQFEYILYRSQLDRWNSSFEALLKPSTFLHQELVVTLLRLGYRSCLLLLNTIFGNENVSVEEDTQNITDIIHDSNIVAAHMQARSNSHFMILQGMIDPARLCEVLEVSNRKDRLEAINMLFRWPRSEGKSESLFVGRTLDSVGLTEKSDAIVKTQRDAVRDTLGEDLHVMKIAYQKLLSPDETES